MDGLGHAIWVAKAERKFRPQNLVDKTALDDAKAKIIELSRQNKELIAKNQELFNALTMAKSDLSTYQKWDEDKFLTLPVKVITKIVCDYFNVSFPDVLSQSRMKDAVLPRHIAFYLCRTHTLQSYPQIGSFFSHRDHTTVMHGAKKIKARLMADLELNGHIRQIEQRMDACLQQMRKEVKIHLSHCMGAVVPVPLGSAAPEDLK